MKRTRLAAIGLVLATFSVAPCAGAELRKVAINFGLTYVPVGNGPVFSVPQAMGFWKEEGLDVQVQLANGSGTAIQQLIAGQVAGSIGGVPPAMALINKGAQIITAASINSRNVYYPVALETSAIKTINDMKGAKIGIVSAASSNVYWIKSMLQKHGLDPDKDMSLVSVGSGPAALQALTSGRIDVLQLFEAAYDQIELTGVKLRRFDQDKDFNSLAFTFGMMVRLDTFTNDPDLLTRICGELPRASSMPRRIPKMPCECIGRSTRSRSRRE